MRIRGGPCFFIFCDIIHTSVDKGALPSCQSLSKLEYEPTAVHTHTKKHVLRLSRQEHEGHPVCVRGAFEVWLYSDVDE